VGNTWTGVPEKEKKRNEPLDGGKQGSGFIDDCPEGKKKSPGAVRIATPKIHS